MMAIDLSSISPSLLLIVVLASVVHFVFSGYKARSHVNRLRIMGLVRITYISSVPSPVLKCIIRAINKISIPQVLEHTDTLQPMPPWNWLSGRLPLLPLLAQKSPPKCPYKRHHERHSPEILRRHRNVLLRPVAHTPTYALGRARPCFSRSNKRLTMKLEVYKRLFRLITGGLLLLDTNGGEWKYWRGLMSAGFAPRYEQSRAFCG